jgi:hypothetical protein
MGRFVIGRKSEDGSMTFLHREFPSESYTDNIDVAIRKELLECIIFIKARYEQLDLRIVRLTDEQLEIETKNKRIV